MGKSAVAVVPHSNLAWGLWKRLRCLCKQHSFGNYPLGLFSPWIFHYIMLLYFWTEQLLHWWTLSRKAEGGECTTSATTAGKSLLPTTSALLPWCLLKCRSWYYAFMLYYTSASLAAARFWGSIRELRFTLWEHQKSFNFSIVFNGNTCLVTKQWILWP